MKSIGIFYGSTMGNTKDAAYAIASELQVADANVHDVAHAKPSDLTPYDVLILGSSTWGSGELQDDWSSFVDGLRSISLAGKKVALFGCGDTSMGDTFCGAIEVLHSTLKNSGAEFIGAFQADDYQVDSGQVFADGKPLGLTIDNENSPQLTGPRIKAWTDMLKRLI